MSNILDDLFFKYHADKTPRIKHHYSEVYYQLFDFKRNEIKKILEIGVAEGASLFAWTEYFKNAKVYGAEIEEGRVELLNETGMKVFRCDQSNYNNLIDLIGRVGRDLDIVIDDGSHVPIHQIFTALTLIPLLNKGAIYVIEDVDDATADMIYQMLSKYTSVMKKVGTRHDDRLIIVYV